jgi:short-subunit dehydrogenase
MRISSPQSSVEPCDVADIDHYRGLLNRVENEHGSIDVLMNNAAIDEPTAATDARVDKYRRIFEINFFALVAGTLAVLPGMIERRSGIVVNVASDSARAPEPGAGAYAASKAAVAAFTESTAHEVAQHSVHLHMLYPAWVATAMGTAGLGPDDPLPPKAVRRTEEQVSQLLLKRMGRTRIEINAASLPLLAPVARTLFPWAYQRSMRAYTDRRSTDS